MFTHPCVTEKVAARYELLRGDLNHDNRIAPADAAIALEIATGGGGGSASCDPATLEAADVSGDGRVTSLDALMILQGCGWRNQYMI